MVDIGKLDTEGAPVDGGKDRHVHRAAIHHHFHLVGKFTANAVVTDPVAVVVDMVGLEAGHQTEDIDKILRAGHGDQFAVDDGDTGGCQFKALFKTGYRANAGNISEQVTLGKKYVFGVCLYASQ